MWRENLLVRLDFQNRIENKCASFIVFTEKGGSLQNDV